MEQKHAKYELLLARCRILFECLDRPLQCIGAERGQLGERLTRACAWRKVACIAAEHRARIERRNQAKHGDPEAQFASHQRALHGSGASRTPPQ